MKRLLKQGLLILLLLCVVFYQVEHSKLVDGSPSLAIRLTKIWEVDNSEYFGVNNHTIYVLNKNQFIQRISIEDGNEVWNNNMLFPRSSMVESTDSGHILYYYPQNTLNCVDQSGVAVWTKEFHKNKQLFKSCIKNNVYICASDKPDYVTSERSTLFCLDIFTGKTLWERETKYTQVVCIAEENDISFWANPTLFALDSEGALYWGKELFCYPGLSSLSSSSKRYLYYPALVCNPYEHKLFVFDVKNGDLIKEIRNLPSFFGYFFLNNKLFIDHGFGKILIYNTDDFTDVCEVDGEVYSEYSICDGYPYVKIFNETRTEKKYISRVNPDKCENTELFEFDHGIEQFHVERIRNTYYFVIQTPDNHVVCYRYQPDTIPVLDMKITILKFTIDIKEYSLDDVKSPIDVAPVIRNGRTLLPARYVTEPLGGQVFWDSEERKVTCKLVAPDNAETEEYKENVVELWIGKSTAKVNGVEVQIDPNNPDVVPTIINDRTMVPMRFLAESLGCEVEWLAESKEIILTYPKQ